MNIDTTICANSSTPFAEV
ncbi:unnamed protein product, partial [Rotaria sp. Silwood1]